MSQVFQVWISECPIFLVKHYGNPKLTLTGSGKYNTTGQITLTLGVCILLRVWDQGEGVFPSTQR
jgi:hypothetical protein